MREISEDKKKIYIEVMNSNILQNNVLITSVIYLLKGKILNFYTHYINNMI